MLLLPNSQAPDNLGRHRFAGTRLNLLIMRLTRGHGCESGISHPGT